MDILINGETVAATPEQIAEIQAAQSALQAGAPPRVGTPRLIATGVLGISDGVISGIETAVGISAAFAMGPGSYWIFFTETQPNLAYSYNVSASSGQINVTTRDTSFIEVTATDGGVPTDPVEISIQVARVQ